MSAQQREWSLRMAEKETGQKHAGSDLSNSMSWESTLEERGKSKDCDHLLGIFAGVGEEEYVFESNRTKLAESEWRACQSWLEQGGGHPISNKRVKAMDTPEKALAARTDFFNFCPRCGTRLVPK